MPRTRRCAALDGDARNLLRLVNLATRLRPVEKYSLAQTRQLWRLSALALGRQVPVAAVSEVEIEGPAGSITLRVFRPAQTGELLPAFVWCHGGGFIVGDLDSGESICRNITAAADCISVAVRYRLAPEHDLNAGREDFLAALKWIAQNGAELGIDSSRLAIGGDSAGGNICAAVAQEWVRCKGPRLALQVLAYPATDLQQEFPSLAENAEGYFVSNQLLGMIREVTASATETLDPTAPWLSPRRNPNLDDLPPALVISAGFDPIRDDGLDYANRLRAAKVPVELLHYPGEFHGFLNFDAVVGAGRDALHRIATTLALVFAGEPAADRTLEISDQSPKTSFGEIGASLLATLTASHGWRDALLRQLSPQLACASQWILRPWLAPSAAIRLRLSNRFERQVAEQTYPTKP
ncbi:alpha/beta hydrolase [Metapseudomonas resinovorans]|uniref:alpha/beta hydrolase n=1 Tax=Metapseudomonas resinovorans TaxID=53412 RepID=UPI00131CA437|nr:alpha/beta hydrolase [Pseudomonas resinovorans]